MTHHPLDTADDHYDRLDRAADLYERECERADTAWKERDEVWPDLDDDLDPPPVETTDWFEVARDIVGT